VQYQVQYGHGSLEIDIPQERLVGILAPNPVVPLTDIPEAVIAALHDPVDAPPLSILAHDKLSALIVAVDNTRPSPTQLIHPILDVLEDHGIAVSVIIATGRHRQMTQDELDAHLGSRIMRDCQVLQHDPFAEDQMVRCGTTQRGTPITVNRAIFEHDLIIGCGVIEPSYLCGWSGGRKLMMPGLAHHASIDSNHFLLTEPGAVIGRLHGNPVSDDAAAFARDLPYHFIVYAVSGPNDEVVAVIAGDPVLAHEKGCALCAPIYQVEPLQADVIISSPGGWPYDLDLVQGKKAILPAIAAVNPGGVIILCAECPDGHGAEATFTEWLLHKTPNEVVRDVRDRQQFNLGAHGANILAKPIVEKGATVILVSCPSVAQSLEGSYVRAVTSLSEAWHIAERMAGDQASILCIEKARRLIT